VPVAEQGGPVQAKEHLHMAVACCNSGNKAKCVDHIDSALEHLKAESGQNGAFCRVNTKTEED